MQAQQIHHDTDMIDGRDLDALDTSFCHQRPSTRCLSDKKHYDVQAHDSSNACLYHSQRKCQQHTRRNLPPARDAAHPGIWASLSWGCPPTKPSLYKQGARIRKLQVKWIDKPETTSAMSSMRPGMSKVVSLTAESKPCLVKEEKTRVIFDRPLRCLCDTLPSTWVTSQHAWRQRQPLPADALK